MEMNELVGLRRAALQCLAAHYPRVIVFGSAASNAWVIPALRQPLGDLDVLVLADDVTEFHAVIEAVLGALQEVTHSWIGGVLVGGAATLVFRVSARRASAEGLPPPHTNKPAQHFMDLVMLTREAHAEMHRSFPPVPVPVPRGGTLLVASFPELVHRLACVAFQKQAMDGLVVKAEPDRVQRAYTHLCRLLTARQLNLVCEFPDLWLETPYVGDGRALPVLRPDDGAVTAVLNGPPLVPPMFSMRASMGPVQTPAPAAATPAVPATPFAATTPAVAAPPAVPATPAVAAPFAAATPLAVPATPAVPAVPAAPFAAATPAVPAAPFAAATPLAVPAPVQLTTAHFSIGLNGSSTQVDRLTAALAAAEARAAQASQGLQDCLRRTDGLRSSLAKLNAELRRSIAEAAKKSQQDLKAARDEFRKREAEHRKANMQMSEAMGSSCTAATEAIDRAEKLARELAAAEAERKCLATKLQLANNAADQHSKLYADCQQLKAKLDEATRARITAEVMADKTRSMLDDVTGDAAESRRLMGEVQRAAQEATRCMPTVKELQLGPDEALEAMREVYAANDAELRSMLESAKLPAEFVDAVVPPLDNECAMLDSLAGAVDKVCAMSKSFDMVSFSAVPQVDAVCGPLKFGIATHSWQVKAAACRLLVMRLLRPWAMQLMVFVSAFDKVGRAAAACEAHRSRQLVSTKDPE